MFRLTVHSFFIHLKGSVTVTVKADDDEPETQPLGYFGLSNGCIHRHANTPSNQRQMDTSVDEKIARRLKKIKDTWQKPAKRPLPHMVDLIARFLFPLTYGIFNFVYWWTQLN